MGDRSATERRDELIALMREMKEAHECPLIATRTKLVFGAGNADADLMFVGEAPGFHEDQQGLPFVGRAGKLLDELLSEIRLSRGDVWVGNVLKCRPPDNRDPTPEEIAICSPYLDRQIELIRPRVICTLGNFATKLITGAQQGITKVHGVAQDRELGGLPVRVFPLFHPAAALRTPSVKQLLREDLAKLPALLEEDRAAAEAAGGSKAAGGDPAPEAASQLGLFG